MKLSLRSVFAVAGVTVALSTGLIAGAGSAAAADFSNVISCVHWRGADGSYNIVCKQGSYEFETSEETLFA